MPARRSDVTIIKKYANRRLYHTDISQYITLDDVADMVRKGEDLKVVDARTGQDLTRAILTQIIVEQEAKGENLLPIKFLREVIRTYHNNLRPVLPHYLDHAMDTLISNQEQIGKYMTDQIADAQKNVEKTIGGILPPGIPQAMQKFNEGVEEVARQNVQMFETAMKIFSPFVATTANDKRQKIDTLRQQIKAIQNRINDLEKMSG